jgi:hypothetical protein
LTHSSRARAPDPRRLPVGAVLVQLAMSAWAFVVAPAFSAPYGSVPAAALIGLLGVVLLLAAVAARAARGTSPQPPRDGS